MLIFGNKFIARMDIAGISTWWQSLASIEKIFWAIALLFSFLFLIQTLLSFIGGDGAEAGGDADASISGDDGTGHQFFTIKYFPVCLASQINMNFAAWSARPGIAHLPKIIFLIAF